MLQKILLGLFILSFFTASCQKKGEESIYLIPKNYEGNVLIIFDQSDGTDTLYEDGKRVYRINSTGILKTKFKSNYGISRNYYFSIDSNGTRAGLRYVTPFDTLKDSNMVVCKLLETGNDIDKKSGKKRHFEMFTVSTIAHSDSIINQKDNFMWNNLK